MIVQLMVRAGKPVTKTVATYQEASEVVRKFIETLGASKCPEGMGLIADGGEIVAHVSCNGRVWAGREWKSGAVPLYDPCQYTPDQIARGIS